MNGTPNNGHGYDHMAVQKLREEVSMYKNKLAKWEEGITQARGVRNRK